MTGAGLNRDPSRDFFTFEPAAKAVAAWRSIVVTEHKGESAPIIEYILSATLLVAVVWDGFLFFINGYLPQPFYYDVSLSLMDLYSTASWAHHGGAYAIWRTVYPPISFDFLRIVTEATCYTHGDLAARDCDVAPSWFLLGVFVLNAALAWMSYRLSDARTAAPRAIAVGLGLPMLYALERGNLLIPCFTAFLLGVGPLVRSTFWRNVALAICVNFKPYLLAVILPAVAKRDWRWLLRFGLAGLVVYLVSFALEGAGTPGQLLANMGGYAGGKRDALWANLYFATSYWPLVRMMASHQGFAAGVSPAVASMCEVVVVCAMRLVQLGSLVCMLGAVARPGGVDPRRFMALYAAMILTTVTNGSSGYALIFLLFLVFFEPWRGPVRVAVLLAAYALSVPFDWAFWPLIEGRAHSFLAHRDVFVSFGVSIGQILRPGLLLIIQFGLIFLTIQDLLAAGPSRKPGAVVPGSVAGARPAL